jgi:uncharacterized zinc-type alcohol dehydrogenase-like protein
VVVFSTSPGTKEDALRLGAEGVIISTDDEQMKEHVGIRQTTYCRS